MPEGDTVWLTAHRLDAALAGRELAVGELRVPQLATTDLRGETVLGVVARGKHLLTRLASGVTLHSHLRMDGSWYLTAAGEHAAGKTRYPWLAPRASLAAAGTRAHRHPDHLIRALLGNAEWLATGYRVHDLRLVPTAEEAQVVGHLGPDLLGPDWDPDEAVRRLRTEPERAIGETLLDQRHLAGIGNLYKCEALFIEGIQPWTPTGDVADLRHLVETAQRLLRANRDHPEQSTTGLTTRGQQHWVYERRGQPCLRCRTPVRRAEQGDPPRQRSTYWCPRCQPPPDR